MSLKGIDQSLKAGAKLSAWRSGGGVLIVRVDSKDNKELGVGEHYSAMGALRLADKGCLSKGKNTAPGQNFVTGGVSPNAGFLDSWLSQGKDFKAWSVGENIVVQFSGTVYVNYPKELLDKVRETGQPEQWEDKDRCYTYLFYNDGGHGVRIKILKRPLGKDTSDSYNATKTGTGSTFVEALEQAIEVKFVEV